ncbi:MAG TPA: PBP1A family penicillin-binding protein [Pyrinomonadaceae bacterium]|nr:PBP1A family penicillin-binding protein [Pyrinomonadaceae bacterium]
MAAAILNLENSTGKLKSKAEKEKSVNKYIHREKFLTRTKQFAAKAFIYSIFIFAIFAIFSGIGFYYFYNQYSALIEQRISSGFWHTRAGLYAAPYKLRKGQKISKDKVVEQLRRSGYVENAANDYIFNGSFVVKDNSVEVQTNNHYNNKAEKAVIKFSDDKVAAISDGESPLEEYEIQPELLTGRSEAKRGVNHALRYDEIPEKLRNAILIAEDQRFFEHRGIDPQGILRAVYKNISNNEIRQGGSTITQQLVKNAFLTPEKTFGRKFSEAFLALALENKMSKEDIFALYCNEIYLGQHGATGVHGVEQAARAYFDKDLEDLTLAEAATIAAMIKNPNGYAPHKNSERARDRREWIIDRLQTFGLVSPQEFETAVNSEIIIAKPKHDDRTVAPYFVDAATKAMSERFESDVLNTNFNLRVYTTIDTQLQEIAEQTVNEHLVELDKIYRKKGLNLQASIVAINPKNGHILAMVGGRDYRQSQFNRVTDAKRQPGSAFKPFIYAAALEKGLTPISVFSDEPMEFNYDHYGKPYKPANYGDSYTMNEITMKTALAKSSNVVAVEAAMQTGLRRVARKAEEFGFENIEPYPSMALGTMEVTPLELASAYAVFANGGREVEPTYIAKIVSGDSDLLYEAMPSEDQVVSDKTAFMITDMLKGVVERGTARKAKGALGDTVFVGKTGTTKDGWFVGYTPNLVTVAWVGFDENEDIKQTGGDIALPLWTKFMKAALEVRPELGGENFSMPAGLTTVVIDPDTGMLADENCPQEEKVVVPTYAASNIHCWKHQPRQNLILAEEIETYELPEEPILVLPSRILVQTEEIEKPKPVVEYKDIDGIPVQREERTEEPRIKPLPKARELEPPKRKIEKPQMDSFLDQYDSQTGEKS